MSSNFNRETHDPIRNLTVRPARGILKFSKSMDESRFDHNIDMVSRRNNFQATGMIRADSKSQKIPHFDEMNIIATYHPVNKDYGHMKIEEPKTPFSPDNNNIEEEMDTGATDEETVSIGIDPNKLVQKLNESSDSCKSQIHRGSRRSLDETTTMSPEELGHRKQFEKHRRQHYNEFEIVRLRKQEIEAELHALEQEEQEGTAAGISESGGNESKAVTTSSSKPVFVDHQHAEDSAISSIRVHVEDHDSQDNIDEQLLTPGEQERRKEFELEGKEHNDEFLCHPFS